MALTNDPLAQGQAPIVSARVDSDLSDTLQDQSFPTTQALRDTEALELASSRRGVPSPSQVRTSADDGVAVLRWSIRNGENYSSGMSDNYQEGNYRITHLQNILNDWRERVNGGDPIPLTGRVDEATETIIRQFQRNAGVQETGVLGPTTMEALFRSAYPSQYADLFRTVELSAYCRTEFPGLTFTETTTHSLQQWLNGDRSRPVTVAVDPAFIPLGTRFEINVNGTWVMCRAEDTGGHIIGNRVDIFTETRSQALDIGRRGSQIRML